MKATLSVLDFFIPPVSLFSLRKPRPSLQINEKRAFLRVNRQYRKLAHWVWSTHQTVDTWHLSEPVYRFKGSRIMLPKDHLCPVFESGLLDLVPVCIPSWAGWWWNRLDQICSEPLSCLCWTPSSAPQVCSQKGNLKLHCLSMEGDNFFQWTDYST